MSQVNNISLINTVLLSRSKQQLEGALNTLTDIHMFLDFDKEKNASEKAKEIEKFTFETIDKFTNILKLFHDA